MAPWRSAKHRRRACSMHLTSGVATNVRLAFACLILRLRLLSDRGNSGVKYRAPALIAPCSAHFMLPGSLYALNTV